MNNLLVFNHHSLPFSNKDEANNIIKEFLKICIKCKSVGLNTILLDDTIDSKWFRLELTNDYFWQDWYNIHNDDESRDLSRAFRSIIINQPLFSEKDMYDDVELFEVEYNGNHKYSALKAAVWNEAPITSFPTNLNWNKSPLSIKTRKIINDEIFENSEELINLFSLEILAGIESLLLQKRNDTIQHGLSIYDQWNDLFPYLKNCGKVREQLTHWSANNTILKQVVESLTILNSFAEKWKDGVICNFTYEGLRDFGLKHRVSGESVSVRDTPSLRREREFWLPSGIKGFFEAHIKISNGYRIHFYPDNSIKTFYIGYIGTHL